ncbi:cytosolic sulfotransferase 5-like [Hordeum vulgare subsp. vulgare]|uniref:cytosolic sulfotransferase 5-like n=1 Tax=Hordeum vulgare subsp. vulgare TaxID=112509 RepID=UPI000B467830|nr:cytosolic sulfotransferase 5-like [Hordeum vulgare subsp. vulgare]
MSMVEWSSSTDDACAIADISSLPLETRFPPFRLRQYGGFWLLEKFLEGVPALHSVFEPRPSDVVLGSFPKCGTTWLKALAFATRNRADHPPGGLDHPLRRRNPHDIVHYLELQFAVSMGHALAALPSPRVLATHLPYSLLPRRITAGQGCRIVYICRDPKDAFVSSWFFTNKTAAAERARAGGEEPPPYTFEEAFELFCDGICVSGPQWRHVLGYWEESRRRPEKVLFLRYEEMLRDTAGNVRKLAEFMGCGFSGEEEASGVVQDIVELCSLKSLKNMDVNKSGSHGPLAHESFFRKGVAGDWSNHMTPAMAERLDTIVEDALRGSGLTFDVAAPEPSA